MQLKIGKPEKSLVMGENLPIMQELSESGFKEQFNMIYFDGPFNSGLIFSHPHQELGIDYIEPWNEYDTVKHYFQLESYLDNYKNRMKLAKELLHDKGIFVLQTNQISGHYVKILLDDVFGRENFLAEIIWKHSETPWNSPEKGHFGYQHETLLFYRKTDQFFRRKNKVYPGVWDDIGGYHYLKSEDTGYPSQKPVKLLERIIEITTEEGDLVGDFYCGSGTLPITAERMKRRWIACDNNQQSIHTVRQRFKEMNTILDFHYLVDEFDPTNLVNGEYIKTNRVSFSAYEFHQLKEFTKQEVQISAYHYRPEVDLLNHNHLFTFQYMLPEITPDGFTGGTVKVARPIPVIDAGYVDLKVPNPYEWVFHHLVHVNRNKFNMILIQDQDYDGGKYQSDFKQLQQQTEEVIKEINGNWISNINKLKDVIEITDVFGYQYMIQNTKYS